jgi:hypothetical protein
MSVQVKTELDRNTIVYTQMSKTEAASLVRFLTLALVETSGDSVAVRFDIRKEWDSSTVLVSPANNTLFGSRAIIDSVITAEIN